jgi:hypothetical protein
VRIEQGMPVTVADLGGSARRVDDVGEEHGGENSIVGDFCLVAGEELGDLLERRPPWFNEVVHIASRELDVLRARYVIGDDVLPTSGHDQRVVGVLDDEGGHADCRKQCPHVQFEHERHHEIYSRGAGRQAFHPCPGCPDLLVPRHVRIDRMLELAGPIHGSPGSDHLLDSCSISAFSHRIREALEHDKRGGAGRMCRREQRRWRERAGAREDDRFATPEIVKHRGDAVGPLLQGRHRARRDGIGRTGARLVEEDEQTERCHRLDPTLDVPQLRKDLTVCEPGRREHEVARAFA